MKTFDIDAQKMNLDHIEDKVKLLDENNQAKDKKDTIMEILMTGLIKVPKKIKAGEQSEKFDEEDVYKDKKWWTWSYAKFLGSGTILFCLIMFFVSTAQFVCVDLFTGAWSFRLFDISSLAYIFIYLSKNPLASDNSNSISRSFNLQFPLFSIQRCWFLQ